VCFTCLSFLSWGWKICARTWDGINFPFFCNFADLMYIPCNNHLVHISLECWYKYSMKRGLMKFINNEYNSKWNKVIMDMYYELWNACQFWHTPNSLRDSNVSPKLKTTKEQKVEVRSLARNTIEGYRGVLELPDGTRKIDKF
jgi:hypothetical protein